jgi:hypothetical protein
MLLFFWCGAAVMLTAFEIKKIWDLVADAHWAVRCGRLYRKVGRLRLQAGRNLDVDALERKLRRPLGLWQASPEGSTFRRAVGYLFRIPVLVLVHAALLLFVAEISLGYQRALIIVLMCSLWCMVVSYVVKDLAHLVGLGPFYLFRRDINLNATHRFMVKAKDLADGPPVRQGLSLIMGLIFVMVFGYASIYHSLYVLDPNAFKGVYGDSSIPIQFIYFTAVTIASVGYGDIYPVTEIARLIAVSNILLGPFLLTILVFAISLGLANPLASQAQELVPHERGDTGIEH